MNIWMWITGGLFVLCLVMLAWSIFSLLGGVETDAEKEWRKEQEKKQDDKGSDGL